MSGKDEGKFLALLFQQCLPDGASSSSRPSLLQHTEDTRAQALDVHHAVFNAEDLALTLNPARGIPRAIAEL